MISKYSIAIVGLLVVFCLADICDAPQKQFYMSYDAIGNRDYLASVFQQVSLNLPQYNITYNDKNGSIYSIVNLKPHLYYNEHRQTQIYHDQYTVNVTLGQLYMSYRFDFTIKHENKNVTGWARGKTLVDETSFLKKIVIIDGALQWDPVSVPVLSINSQFSVEYSDPIFTQDETNIYIQLLNDYVGTEKIKQNIVKRSNELFAQKLKYHLNHQQILKNSSILYKWGNITQNYTNVVKDFRMNNLLTKGLEVFLLFGLQAGKQQCIDLPKQFDQESYGGVQEVISMGTVKNAVLQASAAGLFNADLDKKYEVPYFQFFMGDLGNSVSYADRLPAHDPFTVSCNFVTDRTSQFKISKHDQHDLYVQVPEDCHIFYKSKEVIKVSFDMNLVVRLVAENDSLNARIYQVGIYGDKYYAIDPNFVVTDPYVARYAVTAVLKGLIGKTVFGTGWPTFSRKYPVVRVLDDYLMIFDASQK